MILSSAEVTSRLCVRGKSPWQFSYARFFVNTWRKMRLQRWSTIEKCWLNEFFEFLLSFRTYRKRWRQAFNWCSVLCASQHIHAPCHLSNLGRTVLCVMVYYPGSHCITFISWIFLFRVSPVPHHDRQSQFRADLVLRCEHFNAYAQRVNRFAREGLTFKRGLNFFHTIT